MRVLVATVVHDPRDARIYAREITALVEAGHEVTYWQQNPRGGWEKKA